MSSNYTNVREKGAWQSMTAVSRKSGRRQVRWRIKVAKLCCTGGWRVTGVAKDGRSKKNRIRKGFSHNLKKCPFETPLSRHHDAGLSFRWEKQCEAAANALGTCQARRAGSMRWIGIADLSHLLVCVFCPLRSASLGWAEHTDNQLIP